MPGSDMGLRRDFRQICLPDNGVHLLHSPLDMLSPAVSFKVGALPSFAVPVRIQPDFQAPLVARHSFSLVIAVMPKKKTLEEVEASFSGQFSRIAPQVSFL
jgi:hypothetical protein